MDPDTIYLDYQASTPLDPRVKSAMDVAYGAVGNPSSEQHILGWAAAGRVENARALIAQAIGAQTDEVVFTSGATEADNIAVLGGALGAPATRRRIIVSGIEHKAVLEAAHAAVRFGFTVEVLNPTAAGVIEPEALADLVDRDVAVVSLIAVSNEIGTIQPVSALSAVARSKGALFHVDATQALAAVDVDVAAWGVDALSLSSHKVYGPKGIGALYIANDAPWQPQPLMFGGGQERGLRPGTLATELCVGFGEACRLISEEQDERERIRILRNIFSDQLRVLLPSLQITCEQSMRHPGSLHVRLPGIDASDLLMRLQPRVAASTGSACTSGIIGPSHVLTAIGLSNDQASECLRLSIGRFTTRDEVSRAAEAIQGACRRLAE